MIANPNPITTGVFDGYWITNLGVFYSTPEKPRGFLAGNMLPYDGTHLLQTGMKRIQVMDLATKRASDPVLNGILTGLATECQRQAGKTANVKFLQVIAGDIANPVMAQISFVDGSFHRILDVFGLAATDEVFAAVLNTTMLAIAALAL
ncbi:MAG: hypothetical protein WCS43_11880 [Verrucomicrobiota bacterium]